MYNKILGAILLITSLGAILVSVAFYGGVVSQGLYDLVLAIDPFVLLVASILGGIRLVRLR